METVAVPIEHSGRSPWPLVAGLGMVEEKMSEG